MSSPPVKIQLLKDCCNLPRFFALHLPLHPSLWEIPRHSSNQQLCPHDALLTPFFFLADETIYSHLFGHIPNEFVKFHVITNFGI